MDDAVAWLKSHDFELIMKGEGWRSSVGQPDEYYYVVRGEKKLINAGLLVQPAWVEMTFLSFLRHSREPQRTLLQGSPSGLKLPPPVLLHKGLEPCSAARLSFGSGAHSMLHAYCLAWGLPSRFSRSAMRRSRLAAMSRSIFRSESFKAAADFFASPMYAFARSTWPRAR